MRIEKIQVEGFRLLQDIEILMEPSSTVIVGRNNSGKTSLTDIFDRFTANGPSFRFQDFSAANRVNSLKPNRPERPASLPLPCWPCFRASLSP
jgi:predicted ATP-dependent endonuclease of OLD family